MSETQATCLAGLAALADKLALELVFAEAGKNNHPLPADSFPNKMEGICALPKAACPNNPATAASLQLNG